MLRALIICITLLLVMSAKGYAQQANTPKVYSLLIGLNKMGPKVNDSLRLGEGAISGAGVDIERMKLLMKNISTEPPTILFNETATKKNMEVNLKNMLVNMNDSDVVIVYFTGHGIPLKDSNYAGGTYKDEEVDNMDEAFVLYDDLLSDDELQKWTLKFKKGLLIFIVDACHSGTMLYKPDKIEKNILQATEKGSQKEYDFNPEVNFGTKTYKLPGKNLKARDSILDSIGNAMLTVPTVVLLDSNFYDFEKLDTLKILFYSATSEDKSAYGDASGGIFTYLLVYVYLKLIEENQEFGAFINYNKYAEIINKRAAGMADMKPQFIPSDTLKNLKYVETHFPFKFK
jgi:hypothetical protein